MSLKPTETTAVISVSNPSIEKSDLTDKTHRPLAPLASSETFSDVGSIYRDDQHKKELTKTNRISNSITKNIDFDSLEILCDFQSGDLSNDSHTDIPRPTQSHSRIRFSENTQIINPTKVL